METTRSFPGSSALDRAAHASPDGRTVTLVFGTIDFLELLLNWSCHALALGVHWFVLVAMDAQCHQALLQNPMARAHALLLPQSRNVSKMTVIGDRQRFGLSVLERGFNIVHSDADAYWIKDPWPVLSHGDDIVAERIWGKPLSVVRAWGAAICTGWYFVRSTPAAIAVARATRDEIAKKRARQPNWQASDQYCLNVALHKRFALRWDGNQTMPPASSMATKYVDQQPSRGTATTEKGTVRVAMLAHAIIPRACPVLSATELTSVERARPGERLHGKAHWWRVLLQNAVVLHCFPPGDTPQPTEKRFIFMGHPKHTQAEVAFAKRQNLWRLRENWFQLITNFQHG
jgi:hypothetical protein